MKLIRFLTVSYISSLLIISLISLLSGCAVISSPPSRTSSIVPAPNPNDPCNTEVQAFKETADYLEQPLITQEDYTTLLGATTSAVFTVMRGGSASSLGSDLIGNLREAGTSILSKKTTDYLEQLKKGTADRQQMLARINQDATNDSVKLLELKRKVTDLQLCRLGQIKNIDDRFKNQGKTAATSNKARQEYEYVQTLAKRDNQFINQLVNNSDERVTTYIEADYFVTTGQAVRASELSMVEEEPPVQVKEREKPTRKHGMKVKDIPTKPKVHPQKQLSPGVQQVAKAQQQVRAEQQKIQELEYTIERKKSGLPA